MTVASGITLAVNGQTFVVPAGLDPTTSLNEFLRTNTPYKGAKLGCGEGGCGACAVEVETYDAETGKTRVCSINSCLAQIGSLDGAAVTTSEGLGNSDDGFHPIQERIAGFHASQCGFCTPGMVVACHSALTKAKAAGEEPTREGMEKALDGNLCRCTGYRSILSACKSFAPGDIEDLGLSVFPDGLPTTGGKEPVFPEALKEYVASKEGGLTVPQGQRLYSAPATLSALFQVMEEAAAAGSTYRLVAGNTGVGVFKYPIDEKVIINVYKVKELRAVESTSAGLVVGASTTIAELIDLLRGAASDKEAPFQQVANHLERIAGNHVRAAATLGGNFVLTKTMDLPSDVTPLMIASGASITVASKTGSKDYTIEDYLSASVDFSREVVTAITIPSSKPGDVFWSNRIAARYSNAVCSINTAIALNLSGKTITSARVVFGYPGAAKGSWLITRASTVEAALTGKPAVFETLVAALEAAPADVSEEKFLQSSSEGLLMQALAPLVDEAEAGKALGGYLSAKKWEAPGLVNATQEFPEPREQMKPVGFPIQKDRVRLQASGEAIYTSDLELPMGGLYAKYVLSTIALAEFEVDASAALAMPGVAGFVCAKDVPSKGTNVYGMEEIFADGKVQFCGQAIGLVLAESQMLAEKAAAAVKVTYKDTLGKPKFSIQDAVAADSFYDLSVYGPMGVTESQTGDVADALSKSKFTLKSGYKTQSQYHFYMEPQCAVAIPDEGDSMTVWSSTQGVDFIQDGVAKVMGIPFHKINAKCRRAGGGFGGKSFRSIPFACAAAVAAAKMKRGVRLVLSRNDDMKMVGGRAEMECSFEVGYDETGKITALDLKTFMQAGAFIDIAQFLPYLYNATVDQCYSIPAIKLCTKLCRTNLPPRTIMRAPGTIQALYTIESVIESVAAALGMDPMTVREVNLLKGAAAPPRYKKPCAGEPSFAAEEGAEDEEEEDEEIVKTTFGTEIPSGFYTVPRLWASLKEKAEFNTRSAAVKAFNEENKWRKRGISMLAGRFEMQVDAKPAGVHVYHDGTVLVVSPGHEMGQGLLTKVKQAAAFELSKLLPAGQVFDMNLIHIADNSTHGLPNTGPSWGSTTSEASAEAVRQACAKLNDILRPHFEEMGEAANWFDVLKKVHPMPGFSASKVLLSAFTYFDGTQRSGPPKELSYAGYGVGCSEVEIDVLTGDRRVLRCDIMLDAAYSLNPGVDLGQVEGGFVQGLGMVLEEGLFHDADTGKLATAGTWTYKVPSHSDVPRQINAYLLKDSPNPRCIMSSKAVGEPPCLISVSALTALQAAASAAKEELTGKKEAVCLTVPVTQKKLKTALGLDDLRIASVLRAAVA